MLTIPNEKHTIIRPVLYMRKWSFIMVKWLAQGHMLIKEKMWMWNHVMPKTLPQIHYLSLIQPFNFESPTVSCKLVTLQGLKPAHLASSGSRMKASGLGKNLVMFNMPWNSSVLPASVKTQLWRMESYFKATKDMVGVYPKGNNLT